MDFERWNASSEAAWSRLTTPRMASPTSASLIGYVAYSVRVGRWADARRDAEQLRGALAEAAG